MHATNRALVWSLCVASAFAVASTPAFGKPPASEAPAASQLEALDGFREVKFGAALADIPGLNIEQDHGDVKLYRKDDDLAFGPAKLDAIVYHFFRGKLYAVSLHTATRDDSLFLLRTAQKAFGADSSADETLDEAWEGKTASVFFTMNPKTDEGQLLLMNNETAAQVEKYQDALITEAAKAL
jgi:hypothetical protein